jgi:electron transfer flavoprotein alpha subunit
VRKQKLFKMSVLVYIPTNSGQATKSGLEAASFASALASGEVSAVVSGDLSGDGGLGAVGVTKVLHYSTELNDNSQLARLVESAVTTTGATTIVFSGNLEGGAIAPRVAVRLGAGYVPGIIELPEGGTFSRNVFSGKAKASVSVSADKTVLGLTPNAYGVKGTGGGDASVEAFSAEVGESKISFGDFKPSSEDGAVPLPEADRVVSAGRGLKGPENWGIVEDLARALNASTACSRPVGDMGWRPHHEHVGQTGVTIRPDLYIACGISGAIQHLAGVNQSKVIVVINTDPEAPFFKAADYGIVGDVFEVLPKLTEAIKALS